MDPSGLSTEKDHQLNQERIEDLFRSGRFSDITITCGDAEWKLHKVILSSRCPWFKRVLEEDPEDEINEIIIATDKDLLGWIIKWIYFRSIDVTVYNFREPAYPRLYKAAERFELGDLMLEIERGLKMFLREKAVAWQRAFHEIDPIVELQFLPAGEIDTISGAIVQSYKYDVEVLKNFLVDFAEATMFWPVASGFLKPIFDAVPAYADDVLSYITKRRYIPGMLRSPCPCHRCGRCPFVRPHGTCYYVKVWHEENGEIRAICNFCTPDRPSLFLDH